MLKPLTLGNKTFPINLIQGPLAGISCAPFRRLTWMHGRLAFSCTEMISCNTLNHQPQKRFILKDPEEGPVSFQLSSSQPKELAEATKRATTFGADLIDLNCGCPVNKIRRKGAGSSLLTSPSKLFHLITAMKENTHLPVSIKIRVQGESNEKFNAEIVKVVSESGVDFITVHGRHWTEHYETPCRHNDIQYFVESLSIPVIGNGDVACSASLKKMFATGCAGIMIGRAGVGQPWLTKKLIAEMQGELFVPPTEADVIAMFVEHIKTLSDLLQSEKFAILQARKFAKYYARDMRNKQVFVEEINKCESLNQLDDIVASHK